jgi:hypothetical protein
MDLISLLLAALIVLVIYLVVKWILGVLKVGIDNNILVIGAIILFILVVLGRVHLGL